MAEQYPVSRANPRHRSGVPVAYGAPVDVRSRSIGPHVNREVALYAGLFYMRDDDDDSEGGDLELYRFNSAPEFDVGSRRVPDERVTRCKTIRYASNTLVFFLHSPYALHGVSPRSPTTFSRRHINLVGELATQVFDLSGLVVGGIPHRSAAKASSEFAI